MMPAAAAGILFGVSDVAIKALTGVERRGHPRVALDFVTVVASVAALYASARGLQDGEAVPVIAATSTAANVSGILGGILVFGDPLPAAPSASSPVRSPSLLVVVAALDAPPRCAPPRRERLPAHGGLARANERGARPLPSQGIAAGAVPSGGTSMSRGTSGCAPRRT